MRLVLALTIGLVALPAAAAETRCGWIANPTPGNWWLTDADAEWTIMLQGGTEPAGMELIPDLSGPEYVQTNGNYGYACACLTVDTDKAESRILRIAAARQLPLERCEQDRKLGSPN